MNTTYFGGSSNVFKSALNAAVVSIWTSSIIYTLYLPILGAYFTLSLKSLISSTPVLDAASISIISGTSPLSIPKQTSHWPHGSLTGAYKQLSVLATILATDVFPVPLGPEKMYACANFSCNNAF